MTIKLLHFLVLILCFFPLAHLKADSEVEKKLQDKYRSFSFFFGNDGLVAPLGGDNTDRYLTNVVRIELKTNEVPEFIKNIFPDRHNIISYKIAQDIYTSSKTKTKFRPGEDRPYAGWLYLEVSLFSRVNRYGDMDVIGARIGVVGPYSQADKTQKLIHKIIDSSDPVGWDNQLDNEPALDLFYRRVHSFRKDYNNISFEVLPYFAVTLGNVHINAELGTIIRFGYNIPNDMGQSAFDANYSVKNQSDKALIRFYGFLKGGAIGVYRDIFLDGNTFIEDDPRAVDKYPFKYSLSSGVTIGYKNFDLTVAYQYDSEEFEKQAGPHQAITIMLQYSFNFPW